MKTSIPIGTILKSYPSFKRIVQVSISILSVNDIMLCIA